MYKNEHLQKDRVYLFFVKFLPFNPRIKVVCFYPLTYGLKSIMILVNFYPLIHGLKGKNFPFFNSFKIGKFSDFNKNVRYFKL